MEKDIEIKEETPTNVICLDEWKKKNPLIRKSTINEAAISSDSVPNAGEELILFADDYEINDIFITNYFLLPKDMDAEEIRQVLDSSIIAQQSEFNTQNIYFANDPENEILSIVKMLYSYCAYYSKDKLPPEIYNIVEKFILALSMKVHGKEHSLINVLTELNTLLKDSKI